MNNSTEIENGGSSVTFISYISSFCSKTEMIRWYVGDNLIQEDKYFGLPQLYDQFTYALRQNGKLSLLENAQKQMEILHAQNRRNQKDLDRSCGYDRWLDE